jgi:excisionase family DNA binding protein
MNDDQLFSILQERRMMSPQEVAKRLGVARVTVYQWVRRGKLPAVRVGGKLLIRPSDLECVLQEYVAQASHHP